MTVTVNFVSPLVVTANSTNALDLEFDLSHPAFLVGHYGRRITDLGNQLQWPVAPPSHSGPHQFLLRDIYGTVTSVNSDGSLTITRDFPVEPAAATATSETAVSIHSYDQDPSRTPRMERFSMTWTKAPEPNDQELFHCSSICPVGQVRSRGSPLSNRWHAGRRAYLGQQLVWQDFCQPRRPRAPREYHDEYDIVENEIGVRVPLAVNANTQFFFRTPWNAWQMPRPLAREPRS